MIKKAIFVLSMLLSMCLFSQEEKEFTLDIIAKKTCEYLNSEELIGLNSQQKTIKLGTFIITQYSEYEQQLKDEGIVLDFNADNAGEIFGEKVGIRMVKFCADSLMAFANENDSQEEKEVQMNFSGKIKTVSGEDLTFLEVENNDGIMQKFIWLGNFIGSNAIISKGIEEVMGMNINVTYKNTEFYSRKLNEYIIRKEIIKIEYLD